MDGYIFMDLWDTYYLHRENLKVFVMMLNLDSNMDKIIKNNIDNYLITFLKMVKLNYMIFDFK
ncbi:hypothetical protein J6TS2_17490 [Heyndrickxia sporothermodurans]|nr:hypothetical protein J6TS2_17490 [Heyndrickxia sporothermodurans]